MATDQDTMPFMSNTLNHLIKICYYINKLYSKKHDDQTHFSYIEPFIIT